MSKLKIRHYEAADLAAIRELYAETAAYSETLQLPYSTLEHWRRKMEPEQDGHTCLVAIDGDELVGQLGLQVCHPVRRRHVASLGMGVKASARGSGVGSALLAAAIALCENWLAVRRMEIEVYTDNAAAIALYQKHGFVREGLCRQYAFRNGAYVDVYLMARLLSDLRPEPPTA